MSIERALVNLCTLHYIIVISNATPLVTSGASTITCYTKYGPPAQHAG